MKGISKIIDYIIFSLPIDENGMISMRVLQIYLEYWNFNSLPLNIFLMYIGINYNMPNMMTEVVCLF